MFNAVNFLGLPGVKRPDTPDPRSARRKPESAKRSAELPERSPHARLNFVPDDRTILRMTALGLKAMKAGRFWDRGAIVNLLL
jgi:hypothetical protein